MVYYFATESNREGGEGMRVEELEEIQRKILVSGILDKRESKILDTILEKQKRLTAGKQSQSK